MITLRKNFVFAGTEWVWMKDEDIHSDYMAWKAVVGKKVYYIRSTVNLSVWYLFGPVENKYLCQGSPLECAAYCAVLNNQLTLPVEHGRY